MNEPSWYTIQNIDTVPSPQLVIYPDRVKHNIQKAVEMVGDASRLRPHIKTNKSREVVNLMQDAGIHKFKFATYEEGVLLGEANAPDALMAYQPVGPRIQQLIKLITDFPQTTFSCLVDHPEAAENMNKAFANANINVPIYLDLNVGMNRTGISEGAFDLYSQCHSMLALKPIGIHAYDGHIRDHSFADRKAKCDEAFKKVEALQQQIINAGLPAPKIIVGGSPSFSVHASRAGVECSPGTFVFWDEGYAEICKEQPFVPAALVITRAISLPSAGKVCSDMGHKAIAAENDISRRASFLNAPDAELLSQSEEHGLLSTAAAVNPGAVYYALPFHVCPTVNLYTHTYTVENGIAMPGWPIAAKH